MRRELEGGGRAGEAGERSQTPSGLSEVRAQTAL